MRNVQKISIIFCIVILLTNRLFCQVNIPASYPSNIKISYVRSWEPSTAISDADIVISKSVEEVKNTTTYVDGLGRPIQSVIRQISPSKKDLVNSMLYDDYSRETYKYLPFISTQTNGGSEIVDDGRFKLNPFQQQANFMQQQYGIQGETYFYGQTDYEASPLNRVLKSFAPGNSWEGSRGTGIERSIQQQYLFNTVNDSVKIFTIGQSVTSLPSSNTSYAAGQLYKNVTIDEKGNKVIEFKNKDGLIILKKVQLDNQVNEGNVGWLSTYYIYDDYGSLRYILPPKATALFLSGNQISSFSDELCFKYDYDLRNRMVRKKVPGSAEVYMVYDLWDRMVMVQDGNQRLMGKWLITVYDKMNRPIKSGLLLDSITSFDSHTVNASTSINYPSIVSNFEILSESFYDDYSWVSATGTTLSSTIDNSNITSGTYFITDYNSSPQFATPITANYIVKGQLTGTKTKILGSNPAQYIFQVNFYDNLGRISQVQSINSSGGKDIVTNQYDFSGKVLRSLAQHVLISNTTQTHAILTKMEYDHAGRLLNIRKQISSTINGVNVSIPEKIIVQNLYDELGQLKTKKLGTNPNAGNPLESLTYDYNIRGWMLGANRSFITDANTTNYFGFELGYDKPNTVVSGTNYINPAFDGNISGTIWKSRGDNEKRKFDYSYDNVNRLTAADFNQYTSGNFNKLANVDFSLSNLTYDANGNILSMYQKGLKINSSSFIDKLQYTYLPNSNKLLNVIDLSNDPDTKLGDFRFKNTHPQYADKVNYISNPGFINPSSITDYQYDSNGNMVTDYNKDIKQANNGGIVYNHLNLPQTITVAGKGTINYIYDAGGNKLKKITVDNSIVGKTITTTTSYLGAFIYESKQTIPADINNPDYVDKLLFIAHEEGRIRYKPSVGTIPASFEFDYMLKDHLGNVRMVLTEEQQQDKYPVASLEPSKIATEKNYYDIQDANVVEKTAASGITDYINDNGIGNNPSDPSFEAANSTKLYKLNSNTAKTGLGMTLKVMAGDKLDVFGKSYYFQNNPGSSYNNNLPILDLLSGFLGSPGASRSTTLHGVVTASQINTTAGTAGISSMMSTQTNQSEAFPLKPRAFINVIFFDEQFKAVDFKVSMVGSNSVVKTDHYADFQNLTVPKNGFVYIYCSNESPVNVFFDNIQVVHTRGAILEENHYYPFGMVMAGISSKAAGTLENRYKFNKGTEFNNDFDIGFYETQCRSYDPQIGRFLQVDELAEGAWV